MGLFKSKEDKELQQQEKVLKVLEKYGLNLDGYNSKDIQEKNIENIKRIASDLVGNGMFKTGMALSFAKAEEQAKVSYLSALVEQNWVIIRQNEVTIRLLSRLAK
ncbi:MAG: hypothetical protein AAB971_00915 [Patescibacteria group bacterium]